MINIKTTNSELILIKLPKDATWWQICKIPDTSNGLIAKALNISGNILRYGKHSKILGTLEPNVLIYDPDNSYLPEGNWEIVGKFNELKDEDFEEFMKTKNQWIYFDYTKNSELNMLGTAKESFISLCRFEKIEDDLSDYLIIKKEQL